MRLLLLAAVVVVTPATARADRVTGAMDATLGVAVLPDGVGGATDEGATMYGRFGGGVQRGALAAIAHLELSVLEMTEPTVDSTDLLVLGLGASLRVDLVRGRKLLLQVHGGATLRWMHGSQEVLMLCGVHGGCDDGFHRDDPDYTSWSPFAAVGVGLKPKPGRAFVLMAVELGAGLVVIDRPGQAPDARGWMGWLAVRWGIGT